MSNHEAFDTWCWLRTASHPDVAAFRGVLDSLPETPPTPRRTGFKYINGRPTTADDPVQPGEGWDGECI